MMKDARVVCTHLSTKQLESARRKKREREKLHLFLLGGRRVSRIGLCLCMSGLPTNGTLGKSTNTGQFEIGESFPHVSLRDS